MGIHLYATALFVAVDGKMQGHERIVSVSHCVGEPVRVAISYCVPSKGFEFDPVEESRLPMAEKPRHRVQVLVGDLHRRLPPEEVWQGKEPLLIEEMVVAGYEVASAKGQELRVCVLFETVPMVVAGYEVASAPEEAPE